MLSQTHTNTRTYGGINVVGERVLADQAARYAQDPRAVKLLEHRGCLKK